MRIKFQVDRSSTSKKQQPWSNTLAWSGTVKFEMFSGQWNSCKSPLTDHWQNLWLHISHTDFRLHVYLNHKNRALNYTSYIPVGILCLFPCYLWTITMQNVGNRALHKPRVFLNYFSFSVRLLKRVQFAICLNCNRYILFR